MTVADRIELAMWRVLQGGPHNARTVRRLAEMLAAELAEQPVAWRVKDHADGWIYFRQETSAKREAEATGARIEPLFALEL